jgi:hypothetical protein
MKSLLFGHPSPSRESFRKPATTFILTGLVALGAGCGPSKSTSTPANPPTAANFDPARDAAPQPQPLPANPPMQVIAPGQDTDAILAQLSAELGRYVRYTHAPPKTFAEFAARDPITYPPAPAGKKYVIAAGRVILQ